MPARAVLGKHGPVAAEAILAPFEQAGSEGADLELHDMRRVQDGLPEAMTDEGHSMRSGSKCYELARSDQNFKLALALLSLSYTYQIAGP